MPQFFSDGGGVIQVDETKVALDLSGTLKPARYKLPQLTLSMQGIDLKNTQNDHKGRKNGEQVNEVDLRAQVYHKPFHKGDIADITFPYTIYQHENACNKDGITDCPDQNNDPEWLLPEITPGKDFKDPCSCSHEQG